MATITNKSAGGTSFHGSKIKATPAELKKLFSKSFTGNNNGRDKTNFDFVLETEDGNVFTIYDWKEYRRLKMTESIDWHIGGFDLKTTEKAASEVNILLTQLRKKFKTKTGK